MPGNSSFPGISLQSLAPSRPFYKMVSNEAFIFISCRNPGHHE
jgi:hypothetical protein